MSLVNSALQIGRSAVLAYQSALQVIGNNIANVGVPGYTRLSPHLTSVVGAPLNESILPGAGTRLTGLSRHLDEALEARIRASISQRQAVLVEQSSLNRIESMFNELSDLDLSSLMNGYFRSWSDLQDDAQDLGQRGIVLGTGQALADAIRRMRGDLLGQHDELNDALQATVERANEIVNQVAELNGQIVEAEAGANGQAASLRDQRDGLLRELSDLVEIQVREQDNGAINVYIGGQSVVQMSYSRGLTAVLESEDGLPKMVVRFADNNQQVTITGGQMEGIINSRDDHVVGKLANLNRIAAALIEEVNKIHASGQGLAGWQSLTGQSAVIDPSLALNSPNNGLNFLPQNGSFLITVTDAGTGATTTAQIDVDLDGVGTDTSLNDLRDAINAAFAGGEVTANVTGDGRLTLAAATGFTFTFSDDSSNALAALGLNTFFVGHDASDIDVNEALAPNMLAAATQNNAGDKEGDGTNASLLAGVGQANSNALGGVSVTEYYQQVVSELATTASAARNGALAADVIYESLQAQRESISGVNMDEEAINLVRYERAYQGAARYLSVVDEMIAELLALVG